MMDKRISSTPWILVSLALFASALQFCAPRRALPEGLAESRDRIAGKGLVGEADTNDPDYLPVLRVFVKKGHDLAAGAMNYSAIFKPITQFTLPVVAQRRLDIREERNATRVAQIDHAEAAVRAFRRGQLPGASCNPDEEGNRTTDSDNMDRVGAIRVDCGPECHLGRHGRWLTCAAVQDPVRDHCDPDNCVLNRYWRHRTPADPPRVVSAVLARGRQR